RRVACPANVIRRPVDSEPTAVFPTNVPELCCEHDLAAALANRPPHQPLVGKRPVDVRGVQEINSKIQRTMHRRNRLNIVALTVELGHPHAAETDRGDRGAAEPKLKGVHAYPLKSSTVRY